MLVALSGKIGSGKDTVGLIIQYLLYKKKFPDKNLEEVPNDIYLVLKRPHTDFLRYSGFEIKKFAAKLKQVTALLTGCTVEELEDQEFKKKELGEEWNWFKGVIKNSEGNLDMVRLTPTEEAKKTLPFPNRIKPYTYREMLQRIGTEAMRNQIHENVWVNALFADYKSTTYRSQVPVRAAGFIDSQVCPNWIITDVRFPNELKAIEERGGISIRVERLKITIKNNRQLGASETVAKEIINSYIEHPSETSLDNATFKYTIDNSGTIEELVEKVKVILTLEKII